MCTFGKQKHTGLVSACENQYLDRPVDTTMVEVTCVIVDDEMQNQQVLYKMIDQFCPTVKVLGTAANVEDAVILIKREKPTIVFLDIEMPGGNGFALFDYFPQHEFYTIFTTAHAEYAIKAIKFAAFDYLLKPINLMELREAIEKVAQKIREGRYKNEYSEKMVDVLKSNRSETKFDFSKIALPTADGLELFHVNDIVRCEAERAYCSFYFVSGKKVVVSKSLKEYEDLLEEANFFRIHKSHMVNLAHVKKYIRGKGGMVQMIDGSLVSVAIRKKEEFLKILKGNHLPVEESLEFA